MLSLGFLLENESEVGCVMCFTYSSLPTLNVNFWFQECRECKQSYCLKQLMQELLDKAFYPTFIPLVLSWLHVLILIDHVN